MWEEPCISGWRGSGTVFFVGCNLKCVYCQNFPIAQGASEAGHSEEPEKTGTGQGENFREAGIEQRENSGEIGIGQRENSGETGIKQTENPDKTGVVVTDGSKIMETGSTVIAGQSLAPGELAELFLRLEDAGAHNINLVTAAHFVPGVRGALVRAKEEGLSVPVVYNSSGYELPETLRMLDGLIDIYMPDFKYMSPKLAARYSHAPDYPEVAKAALKEMFRQVGAPVFVKETQCEVKKEFSDFNGASENAKRMPAVNQQMPGNSQTEPPVNPSRMMLKRGMLVRYLLLPGCVIDGKRILKYLYETWHDDIWISIMNQYTPQPKQLRDFPELNRKVMGREYDSLLDYALRLGIHNAYMQEGEAAKESFIPDFRDSGLLE